MIDWKTTKLGEITEFSQGIQVDIDQQFNVMTEGRVRFIRIVDFTKGSEDEIRYIMDPGERYHVEPDDLVMIRYGSQTAGKIAKGFKGVIANNTFKITPKSTTQTNKNYLYYFLKQNEVYEFFKLMNASSTMPAITFGMAGSLDILLPSLFEQERIAEVLSSLDDKIDLLQRNNKTLEQLAESLFRQWFDINNEDVSKHGYLGDYFKDTIGGEWGKDKEDIDHNIEVKCIRGTDIGNLYNGIPKPPIRYIKESKYEKCKLLDGDIIIEISGGTEDQSTGRCHYFNNNLIELLGGKVVFSNFCRLLRPKLNDYTYFLHVYINLIYQRGDFFNLENGTSGIKNLDLKSFLYQEKFFLPTDMDIIRFNKIVTPFFNKLTKNLNQIQQLETLRDTLLPKLMSGVVRVEN